ncbi:MAG: hypothetical protein ACSW8H_05435, partial [bacterium]
MAVNLYDIADAIRFANLGMQYYYYVPSGELVALPDPSFALRRDRKMEKDMDLHPADYVNLPDPYVVDEEAALEAFCDGLSDAEAKAILNRALLSGEPYAEISHVLEELSLREAYEAFLSEAYLDAARDWCSEL